MPKATNDSTTDAAAEAEPAAATGPRSRFDRRSLFAAASAVIMGGGVTAGVAASVADLVEPAADVELIVACQRATTANEKSISLYKAFSYEASSKAVLTDYHPAIAQAARLPACTLSGLQAKARLLLLTLDDPDGEDALAASLARDVLGVGA